MLFPGTENTNLQDQSRINPNYPEWMDLKALTRYCCSSERAIREWIHRPENPLPAVQVQRGKLLVKRSQFDAWMEKHAFDSAAKVDIGGIVNEVLGDFGEPN